MNVLFVCHGNINRSVAGEIVLQDLKPDWQVKSAGVKTKGNVLTSKKMRLALSHCGYGITSKRSTPITIRDIEWSDIVFYMDDSNAKHLFQKFGATTMDKAQKIAQFINQDKIPDPHYQKGFLEHIKVIKMLQTALGVFIDRL